MQENKLLGFITSSDRLKWIRHYLWM